MKDEQNQGAAPHHRHDSRLTYGDLLSEVRTQRERDLEADHPGRKTNVNAVLNTTRSLTAFLEAVGLEETDPVGSELLDPDLFEKSVDRLEGAPDTVRRRRSELKKHVRSKAVFLARARDGEFKNESFGERLERLRKNACLSKHALAKAVSAAGKKPNNRMIIDWISGSKIPSPESYDRLMKLSSLLDVDFAYLTETIPLNRSRKSSKNTGLPRSIRRRISQHLPDDFEFLTDAKKEEILQWVSDNILTTPKEILDDGDVKPGIVGIDLSFYVFSRDSDSRGPFSNDKFISELDEVKNFKTLKLVPYGMQRNTAWNPVSAERADYNLRAFVGAIHSMGMPAKYATLSLCLFPKVIDMFIEWKVARRSGYTLSINDPLEIFESLLHPKTGFISQSPHFRNYVKPIPGFVSSDDASLVTADEEGAWEEACQRARTHISSRIKAVKKSSEKGRDPFEALLPALNSENPVQVYSRIVDEIRRRTPGRRYAKSRAEAMRSLMMIRIGLLTGLRSKNLRELLFTQGKQQRSWKELKRLKRGELSLDGDTFNLRIPREAFKNSTSRAVEDENSLVIPDHDQMYREMEEYLGQRAVLLAGHDDPRTFFIKTASPRSSSAEYTQAGYYEAFRSTITTYGIFNTYTGQGAIEGLRPHGPHSVRHILATTMVKLTGGFGEAAALLMDTEEMVRDNYTRFLPGERHAKAQGILLKSLGGQ
jgi:transcriptional regulator with XRE-family HTH domain/integrase